MKVKLSNKAYNVGKYIAGVALPAAAAFYAGLGTVWGFSGVTEVVSTITLTDTLLGSLLLISTAQYNKEQAVIEEH